MRILFVRHGDPDYANDTLTEKGHREAACLAETAVDLQLGTCYVSPLGRAQHTAEYCLKKTGKTAEVLEFLREFPAGVNVNISEELLRAYPDSYRKMDGDKYLPRIAWDMLPRYLTSHPEYLDRDGWRDSEVAKCSETVTFFCHYGITCVLLSHLYLGKEEPSFAARFCETYSNKEQRH